MKVSFSPPDMSQLEVNEVAEAIRSAGLLRVHVPRSLKN